MTNNEVPPCPFQKEEEATDKQKLAALALALIVLTGLLIAWVVRSSLEDAAQISTVVGGIGTLFLSLLGAVGGAWWFFRRQPLVPRLNVEQEVTVLPGPSGKYLLQVFARLENVGDLPVHIRGWRIWVCPLDPLPEGVESILLKHSACVDKELEWESCAGRKIEDDCFDEIRMRAGEIQEIIASLLVPSEFSTVRIHSFFPHPDLNRKGEDRGWTRYSIINLKGQENGRREPKR